MRLLREEVVDRRGSLVPELKKVLFGKPGIAFIISVWIIRTSRNALPLTEEIHDLQEMNARYWQQTEYTRGISRAAHESREIRLRQIREELSRMMLKRTA
jgi:hypothetical protein